MAGTQQEVYKKYRYSFNSCHFPLPSENVSSPKGKNSFLSWHISRWQERHRTYVKSMATVSTLVIFPSPSEHVSTPKGKNSFWSWHISRWRNANRKSQKLPLFKTGRISTICITIYNMLFICFRQIITLELFVSNNPQEAPWVHSASGYSSHLCSSAGIRLWKLTHCCTGTLVAWELPGDHYNLVRACNGHHNDTSQWLPSTATTFSWISWLSSPQVSSLLCLAPGQETNGDTLRKHAYSNILKIWKFSDKKKKLWYFFIFLLKT